MFQELYALAKTTTLTLLITANEKEETLSICVKPTPRKSADAAAAVVTKELMLKGKPEEFERDFPECLNGYAKSHQSLMEQAAATNAVLEAAKQAQVEKGANATTAATTKPGQTKPAATVKQPTKITAEAEDDADNDDDDNTGEAGGSDDKGSLFD